ncbi:UNKNOWN [Stylonychia lemnae]|uniref:Uncharacterized protein n=1 Tax=Stylonychia lemnae TaxID=5949 RepID=A0A078B097_STYLE|nr:UNKNOWN [Stylonychia lemnae]|eukprot:CDW87919.1 UNKNOWN [Stylonychia lemnae]
MILYPFQANSNRIRMVRTISSMIRVQNANKFSRDDNGYYPGNSVNEAKYSTQPASNDYIESFYGQRSLNENQSNTGANYFSNDQSQQQREMYKISFGKTIHQQNNPRDDNTATHQQILRNANQSASEYLNQSDSGSQENMSSAQQLQRNPDLSQDTQILNDYGINNIRDTSSKNILKINNKAINFKVADIIQVQISNFDQMIQILSYGSNNPQDVIDILWIISHSLKQTLLRKNRLGQSNSLLMALFNVIKKWQQNEEILNLGLRCLTTITLVEKLRTDGYHNLIEFLFDLATKTISQTDQKFLIYDEIKVNSLRVISNFQPQMENEILDKLFVHIKLIKIIEKSESELIMALGLRVLCNISSIKVAHQQLADLKILYPIFNNLQNQGEYQNQIKKYCLGFLHNMLYLSQNFKQMITELGLIHYIKMDLSIHVNSSLGLSKDETSIVQLMISILGHLADKTPTISALIGELKLLPIIQGYLNITSAMSQKQIHIETFRCVIQSLMNLCQIEANKEQSSVRHHFNTSEYDK